MSFSVRGILGSLSSQLVYIIISLLASSHIVSISFLLMSLALLISIFYL